MEKESESADILSRSYAGTLADDGPNHCRYSVLFAPMEPRTADPGEFQIYIVYVDDAF